MANELMTLPATQYPALDPNNDRVKLMMQNLGGEQLSVADFTRIKVPTGGATKWQIESAAGTEVVDTLEGVILHTTRRRAYWSNPNPTQTPPDCASVDMKTGVGQPGGSCFGCPFDQFGSAQNGHGKACKEVRLLFLLRKGQVLPDVVTAPPGSLKKLRKYLMDLSQVGAPYCGVVTQLTLEKATNVDQIAFAKINARMAGKLDESSYQSIMDTIRRYGDTFQQVASQMNDIGDGDTEEV